MQYQFLPQEKLIRLHDDIGLLDTLTPTNGVEYQVKVNLILDEELSNLLNELAFINQRREEIKNKLTKISC